MKKSAAAKAAGTLYVVATPIGNYDDITLRALNALQECDMIICEESKEAHRLLKHYEIEKEIMELNEHNDTESSVECMKLLTQGKKLALISDAGTPLLADPGDILVKTAVKYKIDVRVLPGASSVLTALVRSTHSSKQFVYAGFLSRKNEERDQEIQQLSHEPRTIVLMDTPYRLKTILSALAAVMPERQAYVGCNLTMTNEAHHYGTLTELEEHFEANKFRGEYVIVIEGSSEPYPMERPAAHTAQAVQQESLHEQRAEEREGQSEEQELQQNQQQNQQQGNQQNAQDIRSANGRGRRPIQRNPNEDPLENDGTAIPLPDPEKDYNAEVSIDDYEPVVVQRSGANGADGQGVEGVDGAARDGQRDRNWNNGPRRWNNNNNKQNNQRRWDNNRRPQGNDRREGYSNNRPPEGDSVGQGQGQGGQGYRSGGGNNNNRPSQYGPRDNNNRRSNSNNNNGGYRQNNGRPQYRNNYRDQRDGANPNYREPQRDQQPIDQQPPVNTPNPTPQNTFYDDTYDRRENFGNREGANYSRFDQSVNRDGYGNRTGGYNRGGRGNNRGNFNRGNAAGIDGNRRSDNPVYSHLNDVPPKRRKW